VAVISREWWKLSWAWLASPGSRTPPARKSLFQSSLRVAALGLALGVGALSVTLAIVSGFQRTWSRGVAQALGHVGVQTGWRSHAELARFVSAAPPGIANVEAFWTTQGLLVGEKGGRGILVEGREILGPDGQPLAAPESDPAAPVEIQLGAPLAEILGASKGSRVRALLPGVLKGPLQAEVVSLVSNGMHEVDSRFAVLDAAGVRRALREREPQAFEDRPGDALGLRLYLDPKVLDPLDLPRLEAWVEDYRARLEKEVPEGGVLLRTWHAQKKNLFGAVDLDRRILTLVLSLLTIVAAFNVAASLVILFLERDREMAVLRALGLSRGQFVVWTGLQGLLLGVVGAAGGLVLGRLFGALLTALPVARLPAEIYNISALPLDYVPREQLLVFLFGVAASWGVALLLGLRLSRLEFLSVLGHRR
jgi:lipoprotein-releasing system permease protein